MVSALKGMEAEGIGPLWNAVSNPAMQAYPEWPLAEIGNGWLRSIANISDRNETCETQARDHNDTKCAFSPASAQIRARDRRASGGMGRLGRRRETRRVMGPDFRQRRKGNHEKLTEPAGPSRGHGWRPPDPGTGRGWRSGIGPNVGPQPGARRAGGSAAGVPAPDPPPGLLRTGWNCEKTAERACL